MGLHQAFPEKNAQLPDPCATPASSLREPSGEISLQRSSPFFRLPTELRLMIYHYVLGGYAIHFLRPTYESKDSALPRQYIKMVLLEKIALEDVRQEPLPEEQEGFRDRELLEMYNITYDNTNCIPRRYERNGGRMLLSLLRSCKLAFVVPPYHFSRFLRVCLPVSSYTEAIDILYTANRFHFYSSLDLLEFQHTISPQHMASITTVQLVFDPYVWHWKFPADTAALSSMKGLSELTFLVGRSLKPIRFGIQRNIRFIRDFSEICRRQRDNAFLKVLVCSYVHEDIAVEQLLSPLRLGRGGKHSYTVIADRWSPPR